MINHNIYIGQFDILGIQSMFIETVDVDAYNLNILLHLFPFPPLQYSYLIQACHKYSTEASRNDNP